MIQIRKQIALIEELAANAWPAETVQTLDGWRMRYTGGRSRRINSVWPNLELGDIPLEEKLDLVEDFYRRKAQIPRYQMCPAAQPTDLVEILEQRGYTADAHTQVQISTLGFVLPRVETELSDQVEITNQLPDDWLDFYAKVENYTAERKTIRRGVLTRIGPLTGFASLHKDGEIVAIGLGVVERGWLGLFCMLTHPDHRRQGAATTVLQALGKWGQEVEATHTYLQVMENNPTALALYARAGYKHLYQYYYLEKRE
ncbi:MAG: GNAT family N-acetyltransferase [Chloroflexi bacterium]|nr:MAG: GNAT family N-acetyltransferase [Chloroflexota bacterium]MBL1194608.1 GNAT family N-acetyltransferase [Chloroflexota bacterium]NOH11898.1 GNAT family N-acetyltransferase [Chloroflexota bacterium]